MNATIKKVVENLNCPDINPGIDNCLREAIILGDSRSLERLKSECVVAINLANKAYEVIGDCFKRVQCALNDNQGVSLFTEEDLQDVSQAWDNVRNVSVWYNQRLALVNKYL